MDHFLIAAEDRKGIRHSQFAQDIADAAARGSASTPLRALIALIIPADRERLPLM